MRAALIQMPVTEDKRENLETACRRLREVKARGADVAVLPEMFCCPYDNACFRAYGEEEGGEAQSALSAAVPVVGSILSDAAESVLAGAGLMRGMVGTLGTLAVAGLCLLPLLRLGCQYALYQAASLVAAAVGPKKLVKLLSMLGDAFGLVLAMTAASALLLLVSLMTSVLAVTP